VRDEFHSIPQPYFDNHHWSHHHLTLPGVSPGKLATGWLDIDTGAYQSGWLTGLDITNRMSIQVNVYQHRVRTMPWNKQRPQLRRESVRQR